VKPKSILLQGLNLEFELKSGQTVYAFLQMALSETTSASVIDTLEILRNN
jgi:hypothetical protein